MNSIKYCFLLLLFGLLISSCSITKNSLITELKESKEKNKVFNVENQKLINRISKLELALKDSEQKNESVIIITPTIDIYNKPTQINHS